MIGQLFSGWRGVVDTESFVPEQTRGGKRSKNETPFTELDVFGTGPEYVLVGRDDFVATHPDF